MKPVIVKFSMGGVFFNLNNFISLRQTSKKDDPKKPFSIVLELKGTNGNETYTWSFEQEENRDARYEMMGCEIMNAAAEISE